MRSQSTRWAIRAAIVIGLVAGQIVVGGTHAAAGRTKDLTPSFSLVATNTWAASQPTPTGQMLVDLEIHDGRVWAGYGDYGANTGPVTIASYEPDAEEFAPAFTLDSEAAYSLRDMGNELMVPATDPRVDADYAQSGPWRESRPFHATHVYDAATITGTDRWLVGSEGRDAVAWRSLDGGATWTEMLRVAPATPNPVDYARFYFAGSVGSKLYVQAYDHLDGAQSRAWIFEDQTWSEGPSILSLGVLGARPMEFGEGFVFHQIGHGRAGGIYFFDGVSSQRIAEGYDVEVHAGDVYVLGPTGEISRSAELRRWERLATGPATARSLAVDESTLYLGTATSELMAMPMPGAENRSAAERGKLDREGTCSPGQRRKGQC